MNEMLLQNIIREGSPEDFGSSNIISIPQEGGMPGLKDIARKIVNEDPDGYFVAGEKKAGWRASDSHTFMTFPGFSVIAIWSGVSHREFSDAFRECTGVKLDRLESILDQSGLECDNMTELLKCINNGVLSDYIDGYDDDMQNFRDLEESLSGRLWTNSGVISFWNEEPKVLRLWPQVQSMFKHFRYRFAGLDNYRVDWLERQYDEGGSNELTPASSVNQKVSKNTDPTKHPEEDESGQLNFIAKMFKDPSELKRLPAERLKALKEKLHVLEPAAKNQLMKLAGQFVNKAAEIADTLGMTVAEFHHLTQVAEANTSS